MRNDSCYLDIGYWILNIEIPRPNNPAVSARPPYQGIEQPALATNAKGVNILNEKLCAHIALFSLNLTIPGASPGDFPQKGSP